MEKHFCIAGNLGGANNRNHLKLLGGHVKRYLLDVSHPTVASTLTPLLTTSYLRRRGLQCKDGPTQLVTARLICAVASRLDVGGPGWTLGDGSGSFAL